MGYSAGCVSGRDYAGRYQVWGEEPQKGHIHFDDWDIRSLDENWLRSHVACFGQQGAGGVVILDEKSVFENISAAVHGHSSRLPSLKEVEACRAALMHEFVRDLPQGYDTLIGGGAGLGLRRSAPAFVDRKSPTAESDCLDSRYVPLLDFYP
jgi:ABC-type protease/lipase transport system fused ATPase/permease subunit